MNLKVLRIFALVGIIIVALKHIFYAETLGFNQYFTYYPLYFTVLPVAFVLFIVQRATIKLFKHPDVLIPAVIYLILLEVLSLIFSNTGASFNFLSGEINLSSISVSIITYLILNICLYVLFAGWQTLSILQLIREDKVDVTESISQLKHWFPRSFAALAIGLSPLFLLMGIIFLLIYLTGNGIINGLIYPFIFIVAIGSLGWNLTTALLLPYFLESENNILDTFKQGIQFSKKHIKKFAFLVILQMLVIGWIMFITVHYQEKAEFGELTPKAFITNTTEVTFVWVGDYPHKSKWNEKLMKTVKAKTLEVVDFKLSLLLLLLAIVIKIQIFGLVWGQEKDYSGVIKDFGNKRQMQFTFTVLIIFILYLLPFERLLAGYNLKGLYNSKKNVDYSVKNNPHFEKALLFEIPEDELIREAGQEKTIKVNKNGINDIVISRLDEPLGREMFILFGEYALVLNEYNEVKRIINFKFEKPKYNDGSSPSYDEGKIIDVNNDGKYEFLLSEGDFSSGMLPQAIFDQNGEQIWKSYLEDKSSDKTENADVKILAIGKSDETKPANVFVIDENGIKPFDIESDAKLKITYSRNHLVFKDAKSNQFLAIVKSTKAIIKNTIEKPLKNPKKPFLAKDYVFNSESYPQIIYFEKDNVGLFDFDENLISKYDAPESEIEFGFLESYKAAYNGAKKVSVFQSIGKRFKSNKDELANLAVFAKRSGENYFTGILYIYDNKGKLLLTEFFGDAVGLQMFVIETENEKQNLIIENEGEIWIYKEK